MDRDRRELEAYRYCLNMEVYEGDLDPEEAERLWAALAVDETVYVGVYNANLERYEVVTGAVKGKWRVFPSDRYPFAVAVELSSDVGWGTTRHEAGETVPVALEWLSRSSPDIDPSRAELGSMHLAELPEVRLYRGQVVPAGEPVPHAA